jgi:hypothetical protein
MRSSNKRLLSIFKQCCEKGTRERCRRPNSDVLAREREGVGRRVSPPHDQPLAPSPGGAFLSENRSGFSNSYDQMRAAGVARIKAVNWCGVRCRMEKFLLLVDLVAFAGVSAIFFSMAVAGKRAARRH